MLDADLINQPFHIAEPTEGRHEVAIPISTLSNVACSGTIDVKVRVLKNILEHLSFCEYLTIAGPYSNPFNTFGFHSITGIAKPIQTIALSRFKIPLNIKVEVSILLVQSPTLLDNPVDISDAFSLGLLV